MYNIDVIKDHIQSITKSMIRAANHASDLLEICDDPVELRAVAEVYGNACLHVGPADQVMGDSLAQFISAQPEDVRISMHALMLRAQDANSLLVQGVGLLTVKADSIKGV